jgi:hypothetical protein
MLKKVIIGSLAIILLFVGYIKWTNFWEIDKCLDAGGAWNDETNKCEYSIETNNQSSLFRVEIDSIIYDSTDHLFKPYDTDSVRLRIFDNANHKIIEVTFDEPDGMYYEFKDSILNKDYTILNLVVGYEACCYSETTYTYILSNKKNITPLPSFNEVFCDCPEPFIEYMFSNQSHKLIIEKTKFIPGEDCKTIHSKEILQRYEYKEGSLLEIQ